MAVTRKSSLLGKITVLFFICCFCIPAWGKYGGGSGTHEEPYLIYDANQMNSIGADSSDWDKCFKLMADIDLSVFTGTNFNIIGTNWDNVFTGVFDGNGHIISNFIYTSTNRQYIGLFGYISGANAEIENLGLINPDVDAGSGECIGSLAGFLKEGTISNCCVEGGSVAGQYGVGGLVGCNNGGCTITNCYSVAGVSGDIYIGGLVGRNYRGTIINCYAAGSISGRDSVGGLVGYNYDTISMCYATGSVDGDGYSAGGLVGENEYGGTITDCYANSLVSVRYDNAGGLVGRNGRGRITNCYSTGTISGNDNVGGLVGDNYQGLVIASFWDFQASGPSTSDGGIGLTTAEMQTKSTFMAWGCGPVWTIDEGVDYPRLVWENAPGEPITTPSYGGGSGEPNDPYLIYTAEQLNTIGSVLCHLDKHFRLCADIDLDIPPIQPPPSLFKASNPNPAHGAYLASTTADLSWTPGLGATSHDVYFGTTSIPPFVCNQTSTTFDPGTLTFTTKYYWHIDEVNDSVVTAGEIWNFTTLPSPPPTPPPLMADIDLGQIDVKDWREKFNIIGYNRSTSDNKPFTGAFDGNGHTISNFTYTYTDRDYIGLFGHVRGGVIKNLGLIGPNVGNVDAETVRFVGSLVGCLEEDGTIDNCYVQGGRVAGRSSVGGLVGTNKGTINDCSSSASVSGDEFIIGGLVGTNSHNGNITNSYATGSVVGDRYNVGGLVGLNLDNGNITNCYATASVSGDHSIGGLVGFNSDNSNITNSYATGSVSGDSFIGGLVGKIYSGTISNCYSTASVTGDSIVGGLVGWQKLYDGVRILASFWDIQTSGQGTSYGGTGLPTARMQVASTFLEWGGCGNEVIWTLDEGNDYPHLWWEQKPGEPLPVFQLSDSITGTGTQIDPYLIYTAPQLNSIGLVVCDWDKHFKLMADIDMDQYAGIEFNIIGTDSYPFTGVFDGNGKKIFNFTCTATNRGYIGLFGNVSGVIKDLGLIEPNIDAGTYSRVGSLVACLENGSISNCYVEGGRVTGEYYVGGMVGSNYDDGTITNCYSIGDVSGINYVGGLVGYNENSIVDCYTSGNVTGGNNSGGLCGKSTGPDHGPNQSRIQNCFSKATVTGDRIIGGLIGHSGAIVTGCYSRGSVNGSSDWVGGLIGSNGGRGSISNCYSTGSVTGNEDAGGLVGYNQGTVSASFWDIETSGQVSSYGGTGLPTAQMQTINTFTDAGWDFVGETTNGVEDIWFIPKQDYPRLWWEGMQVPMKLTPGTLNCRSRGGWIKARLTLPEGFTVADVDSNILGWIDPLGIEAEYMDVFIDEDGQVRIDMAFDRAVLCEGLTGAGSVEITVGGFLINGRYFYGTETIKLK
jgi:hypothetical protein